MLRFTRSGDGESRATVRVDFRVERESIAQALAHDAMTTAKEIPISWHSYFPGPYTKAGVEAIVRLLYYVYGPPAQWPESEADEDWDECLEAATDYVNSLWREGR